MPARTAATRPVTSIGSFVKHHRTGLIGAIAFYRRVATGGIGVHELYRRRASASRKVAMGDADAISLLTRGNSPVLFGQNHAAMLATRAANGNGELLFALRQRTRA